MLCYVPTCCAIVHRIAMCTTMIIAVIIDKKKYFGAKLKPFETDFFDSNQQRKTPILIRNFLSSPKQPITRWPKAPDFVL